MTGQEKLIKFYDWWIHPKRTNNGQGPSATDWLKAVKGLKSLAAETDAPVPLSTAATVAEDRLVRTWAIIERCLYLCLPEDSENRKK